MLGPGILLSSTPFALGYSLYARTRVTSRPLIYAALALAAAAAVFLLYGAVAILVQTISR
jgi:hypothetical protein